MKYNIWCFERINLYKTHKIKIKKSLNTRIINNDPIMSIAQKDFKNVNADVEYLVYNQTLFVGSYR